MEYACYACEARGIQSYILDSGRLRDMVAASELVESLCQYPRNGRGGDKLGKVLAAVGLEEGKGVHFLRRAAGVFLVVLEGEAAAKLDELRALWSLYLARLAPGLPFAQAHSRAGEFQEAVALAERHLHAARNRLLLELPVAGPFSARSPRTGRPAVTSRTSGEDTERVDGVTVAKRRFHQARSLRDKLQLPAGARWPEALSVEESEVDDDEPPVLFPFLPDDRYVAVVAIDGNDLGSRLRQLEGERARRRYDFSLAVSEATREAAAKAVGTVLHPRNAEGVVPGLPLVLGGDDLVMILRGDVALEFTEEFLWAFEELSARKLDEVLPDEVTRGLTACAGIAYVKANQPFYMAFELAESQLHHAKETSRERRGTSSRIPSSVAFHRVTTSLVEEYGTVVEEELTTPRAVLSMQPYGLTGEGGLPSLAELRALRDAVTGTGEEREEGEPGVGRGAIRELLRLFHYPGEEFGRAYRRWREVLAKHRPERLRAFDAAMEPFLGGGDVSGTLTDAEDRTPLADALTLAGFEEIDHER